MSATSIKTKFLNAKKVEAFIYLDDTNEVISRGTLLINLRDSLNKDPTAFIEDIWTHENYRNQGNASKIIQYLIDVAKSYNCFKVILHCNDSNLQLYNKFGFYKHQNNMRLDLS